MAPTRRRSAGEDRRGRVAWATRGAAFALSLAGYGSWVSRRNRRLRRPPVRGPDGTAYPTGALAYSDGVTVGYLDVGDGDPVVLIPGADGMKETFRYQIPVLAGRYRVVSADIRDRYAPGANFDRLADDVAELMAARNIERATVVGQSLGGAVALRFATRYPNRVDGLVIANSLTHISLAHVGLNRTSLIPLARFTTRYLPTALSRAFARLWSRAEVWIYDDSPGWANVVDYALWTGPRTVPAVVGKRRVDLFRVVDLRAELGRVRAETLVIHGERDFYMPPGWWREILAAVPGSRSVAIAETGHCSHLSMPGVFNRVLLGWMRERETAGEDSLAREEAP